jgi:HNH endonuclease
MRPAERAALRVRFVFRCGYGGIGETDVGAELTIDHFHPSAHGGSNEPDNLIYCCHACNEFKGDYWQPGSEQRILHPLLDDLSYHIAEQPDGVIEALSETGRFHIDKLRLNRVGLVAHRQDRRLRLASAEEQSELSRRMSRLEDFMRDLGDRMRRLERRSRE